jgi:hypothetical protein
MKKQKRARTGGGVRGYDPPVLRQVQARPPGFRVLVGIVGPGFRPILDQAGYPIRDQQGRMIYG